MPKKQLKIAFFGTPDFAVPALKSLIDAGHGIAAVITQPDKEIGRNKTLAQPPVKITAIQNNIKVLQPKTLKDDVFFEEFKNLNIDLAVVAAYGKIIPKRILDVPEYGFINIHPSLLPKYRGPSPIQSALLNGDKETGVSIMVVDDQVDHGPVLAQQKYQIWPKTTFKFLNEELANLGAKMIIESIPDWVNGGNKGLVQDDRKVTFTKMFERADARIDWDQPAEDIFNRIRALSEEPGVWTVWKDKILNIKKAEVFESAIPDGSIPGTITQIDSKIIVATQTKPIILKEIQPEGGKVMDASSFTNGHRDFVGSKLD